MNYHYYASSVGEWMVDKDLVKLLKDMERGKLPFMVWLVPVPEEAHYQIRQYAPQVEGAVVIYQSKDLGCEIADQFVKVPEKMEKVPQGVSDPRD
jgi:hypothetical protein